MSALLSYVLYRRGRRNGLESRDAFKQVALGQAIGGTSVVASAVSSSALIDRRVRRIGLRPVGVLPVGPAAPVPAAAVTMAQVDAAIDAKIDPVSKQLSRVEKGLFGIGAKVDEIGKMLAAIDKRLQALEANDARVKECLLELAPENQKRAMAKKLEKLGVSGTK